MNSAHLYQANGSKMAKIALITGLHAAFVLGLMNMKVIVDVIKPGPVIVDFKPDVKQEVIEPPPVLDTEPLERLPITVPDTTIIVEPTPDTITARRAPPSPLPQDPLIRPDHGTEGSSVAPKITPSETPPSMAMSGDCARPDYPARAAREGAQGTVTLALLISASGKVADAKVQRTSGSRDLDKAAIAALSMCKFKPATANGVPAQAWGQIAYVWTLEN